MTLYSAGGQSLYSKTIHHQSPGITDVPIPAPDLPAGVYLAEIRSECGRVIKKLTVVK